MESVEEQQRAEIEVLKSIYSDDFKDSPPPKAWKGAVRQPEFIIKASHPNARYQSKLFINLNVKFPKTYPAKAAPLFTIVPPLAGISQEQAVSLNNAVQAEARKYLGSEMVFQIVTFCQEWIESNVSVPAEGLGSLAKEMEFRNLEERKNMEEQEHAKAKEEIQRAQELEAEIMHQIEQDTRRKAEMQRLEKERNKARRRAMSDATEKPVFDVSTESFDQDIIISGARFNSVKLYHGRDECLGVTYSAEPIFEDPATNDSNPLELHVVLFESAYYTTNQGRKKLRQVENELLRLVKIQDKNVIRIYAAQLSIPKSNEPCRLSILREQKPALTLQDILTDCDTLREERISDYFAQILGGLHAIHSHELVHRGIRPKSVALVDRNDGTKGKGVKLINVSYEVKLLDMHRSDPFGPKSRGDQSEMFELSDGWLPREAIESPLTYTRGRDLHAVGVVLLQMLMGLDVIERYSNAKVALQSCETASYLLNIATEMLSQTKKSPISCISLLGRLSQASQARPPRSRTITDSDIKSSKTLMNTVESGRRDSKSEADKTRPSSRWRDDWEELEVLGKGGFGSVVKARNKIDERIYAVKKIKLKSGVNRGKPGEFDRGDKNDRKIFREVNALSRLSHRYIVRYFTTWVEESLLPTSNVPSDSESDDDQTTDGLSHSAFRGGTTTAQNEEISEDPLSFDINDLTTTGGGTSFPSLYFTSGDVMSGSEDEGTDEDDDQAVAIIQSSHTATERSSAFSVAKQQGPPKLRTLYIQMEYVERQTLQERIAEGLAEDECWRLFLQVVDALVHMSSLGILHRDIKCTNIFIDSNGDCKVGDFGLATSSLAAVDPSDVSPHTASALSNEFTADVGTRFYIAPEVLSRRKGPRDHSKADIYSLGVVFFEMNYVFNTGSERIFVLERLRHPEVFFPVDWDEKRATQKSIILWLLQHDPSRRPTALELSQSSLLPARVEDEYFKEAVRMITQPDSPHYQAVLSSLFRLSAPPARGFIYDSDLPDSSSLKIQVVDRLTKIFSLHGARNVDVPLLMPKINAGKPDDRQVHFLDKYGEVVSLASNAVVPFARLASRSGATRIKRYHIGDLYKDALGPGHPRYATAAIFDIITTDLQDGPLVASAELITLAYELMKAFPRLSEQYVIRVSHLSILELVIERIPKDLRNFVLEVLADANFSVAGAGSGAWRNAFSKKGLIRSVADDIETLASKWDNLNDAQERLDRNASVLSGAVRPYLEKIKQVAELAKLSGVPSDFIDIHPMPCRKSTHFQGDLCFEVVRRSKKTDIIAGGGRYDRLISKFSSPMQKTEPFCAFTIQIALDRIMANLVEFQKLSMSRLNANTQNAQRSYGYWTLRRCDVYVAAFQPGLLLERLELVALLWKNGISADLMYEGSVPNSNADDILEQCSREGILFVVFVKAKGVRKEDLNLKMKNVLSGWESETKKQDLVPLLQHHIHEQSRLELETSGLSNITEVGSPVKETMPQASASAGVPLQMVLPGDVKKIRKQTKQIFTDKAYDTHMLLTSQMQSGSLPMLAIDVIPSVFEAMAQSNAWVSDDETWRGIARSFPTQHSGYASQIHEAVMARKEEGAEFLLLFSCKDERTALVNLT